jgi:hypothetical protein
MPKMMTKEIETKLKKNFEKNSETGEENFKPVLKLFGGSACTWLITEYDEENQLFFGLADLGLGFPELGWISKTELEEVRFPPFNSRIERDMYFTADKTLSEYAKEAKENQRIIS